MLVLELLHYPKIDFTLNLNGIKILKFPLCEMALLKVIIFSNMWKFFHTVEFLSSLWNFLPSRVRRASPKITPPITPASVAKVSALPFRQFVTFSFVNLAIFCQIPSSSHFQSVGTVVPTPETKTWKN